MYSLATADALFALYVLMQYYLYGKEFPVLVPLPTVLLFVTSRCVRMSSSLERPEKVFHSFSTISDFVIVRILVDNPLRDEVTPSSYSGATRVGTVCNALL